MYSKDLTKIWNIIQKSMEKKLSNPTLEAWSNSMKPVAFVDNILFIEVPDIFTRDWLKERCSSIIKDSVQNALEKEINVKFILKDEVQEILAGQNNKVFYPPMEENIFHLNTKYTFDTFVVGNSNRFAHAASLAVADSPAKAYNPLFIYGGVGLGKTHLMHAIGHHLMDTGRGELKIAYVTSEKFTNELINAIKDDKTTQFRNKYRSMDILLIDDIQFLARKERTQEEFFHTFNTLHEANKQIVISSDRPPKEIPTLEDRLRSRFEWGLITDIQTPDFETRIAILRKKVQLENYNVPEDVISFIAERIPSNIRELEGALIRLIAYSSFIKSDISLDTAESILKDIMPKRKPRPITAELIQQVVSEHYNLKVEDLKAKKRTRAVSFPRQISMYITREMTDLSLPKIGEYYGGRDHTTVIHAHERISTERMIDSSLETTINELINKIKNN